MADMVTRQGINERKKAEILEGKNAAVKGSSLFLISRNDLRCVPGNMEK